MQSERPEGWERDGEQGTWIGFVARSDEVVDEVENNDLLWEGCERAKLLI